VSNNKRFKSTMSGTGNKRQKTIITTPVMKDIEELVATWTPERVLRSEGNGMKVRGLEDGPLRGGDYVLNTDGDSLTLSCCFERDGLTYGITVGHLASKVSETIFAFDSGTPIGMEVTLPIMKRVQLGQLLQSRQKQTRLCFLSIPKSKEHPWNSLESRDSRETRFSRTQSYSSAAGTK
jgi:hypothetical protein